MQKLRALKAWVQRKRCELLYGGHDWRTERFNLQRRERLLRLSSTAPWGSGLHVRCTRCGLEHDDTKEPSFATPPQTPPVVDRRFYPRVTRDWNDHGKDDPEAEESISATTQTPPLRQSPAPA